MMECCDRMKKLCRFLSEKVRSFSTNILASANYLSFADLCRTFYKYIVVRLVRSVV